MSEVKEIGVHPFAPRMHVAELPNGAHVASMPTGPDGDVVAVSSHDRDHAIAQCAYYYAANARHGQLVSLNYGTHGMRNTAAACAHCGPITDAGHQEGCPHR